ncbi:MAG: gliding motility protein GldM [Bacteroidia bacterium]|nr:gliding motility protein GldM [Bacteroidia bacterium]
MAVKNCPETPRQRMISMMYLVLTALLALNVSRETIMAFAVVETGLSKTIENFSAKNDATYGNFQKAELENATKVKPWRERADEVRKHAADLYKYIQDLKIEIVRAADGKDAPAIKGNKVYSDSIKLADNMDYPSVIMIGSEKNGKAYILKKKINEYRDYLVSLVAQKDKGLIESIKNNLNTANPPASGTDIISWEVGHFEMMPLIAVITMLSKMQSDVRNGESDLLTYLYKQIDASSFKFNSLEAIVKAKSNFIFKDGSYEADVFLAASDTTQTPEIFIGRYDSTIHKDGTIEYNMIGVKDKDYKALEIVNGKGKFKAPGSTVNPSIKWGGLIFYKAPGGGENHYPFKAEYQVAEIGVVVSPAKMNVFYYGVDNPVDISVPGIPSENITPNFSNGSIIKDTKTTGGWIVRPDKVDMKGLSTFISVNAKIDGKLKEMGKKSFRVKTVPDPMAKVGGQSGGFISKNLLMAQNGVAAEIENFDFEMPFTVSSFLVSTVVKNYYQEYPSPNNKFTDQQLALFKNLRKGDKIYFEDIKAKGPDKTTRSLQPLVFRIN